MMNEELIKEFLNKKNIFSVVGASRDPKKYGYPYNWYNGYSQF